MNFGKFLAKAWHDVGVRIYLTGRLAIEAGGKVVVEERQFRGKQGRLLFTYLVWERTRPVSKEELAAVLWPENLSPAWESGLSSLTSRLGSLLSSATIEEHGLSLSRGLGQYQVRLPSDVWIDVEAATSALDRAEAAVRTGDPGSALGPATVATSIAGRPFLPGVDGFWPDSQRRKLERQMVRSLDCLNEMQLAVGEPESAVETALKAVGLDQYRKRTYQSLMRAYAATGNRAEAVSVYHRFRELLATDLGTEPSQETEAIYLQLLG